MFSHLDSKAGALGLSPLRKLPHNLFIFNLILFEATGSTEGDGMAVLDLLHEFVLILQQPNKARSEQIGGCGERRDLAKAIQRLRCIRSQNSQTIDLVRLKSLG